MQKCLFWSNMSENMWNQSTTGHELRNKPQTQLFTAAATFYLAQKKKKKIIHVDIFHSIIKT